MWLESTPGVGSTFGFSIPRVLKRTGRWPVRLSAKAFRSSFSSTTTGRRWTSTRPTWTVHQPGSLRARDGVEALELARKVLPAAVVLEIRLPKLDGWQVLADLKADPATTDIPVVIATVVDDRSRGLSLGAEAYLRKPIRREELMDALRRIGAVDSSRDPHSRSRHDRAPHPRGRGQSVESQAGSRRIERSPATT